MVFPSAEQNRLHGGAALEAFIHGGAEVPESSKTSFQLTGRERQCLEWAARGKGNWDVAVILGISEHTVDFHIRRAMTKLGVSSRISAVVRAMQDGLIEP